MTFFFLGATAQSVGQTRVYRSIALDNVNRDRPSGATRRRTRRVLHVTHLAKSHGLTRVAVPVRGTGERREI